MEPATGLKKAALISAIVGSFSFYMYFKYYLWLGILVGAAMGATTFALLARRTMQQTRRIFLVTISALVWIGFFSLITWMGIDSLLMWVSIHVRAYYLPGPSIYGAALFPCTREVPQILLGTATFAPPAGFNVVFPSTLEGFMILTIPFILTALIFGRGFCGWMCYFGGVAEAFVTGKKERWKLSRFREKVTSEGGSEAPAQLRDEVRDVKYGVLLGILLLAIGTAIPAMCMVCWALWLDHLSIFWLIMGVFLIFVFVLPFLTKRRWWCIICPIGAVLNLLEKVNPFRIKIDEVKCDECFECVHECRMYAMTTKAVEETRNPNLDCIKCGRCIEVCPKDAVDLYVRGTKIKARTLFIPLAIAATVAWYVWFIVAIVMIVPRLLGLG